MTTRPALTASLAARSDLIMSRGRRFYDIGIAFISFATGLIQGRS